MTYEQAVKEFYYSLFGQNPSNYHAELFLLIQKADAVNKERLRASYAMEVKVFEDWQKARSQPEFFGRWGLKVPI